MKPSIDDELKKWKDKTGRKVLLLRGARQVGKTRSIRMKFPDQLEHLVPVLKKGEEPVKQFSFKFVRRSPLNPLLRFQL